MSSLSIQLNTPDHFAISLALARYAKLIWLLQIYLLWNNLTFNTQMNGHVGFAGLSGSAVFLVYVQNLSWNKLMP